MSVAFPRVPEHVPLGLCSFLRFTAAVDFAYILLFAVYQENGKGVNSFLTDQLSSQNGEILLVIKLDELGTPPTVLKYFAHRGI